MDAARKNTSVFVEGVFSRKKRKDRKAGGPTSVSATIDRSGWKRVRLGEVCKIIMGQSPDSSGYNVTCEGLPLIQGNADIQNRKTIVRTYTKHVTKQAYKGDLLLTVRAPVGNIARVKFNCSIGRGVCALHDAPDYLYHYFESIEGKWGHLSGGSTFDSINSDTLASLEIPLPKPIEQSIIVSSLSSIDTHISALQALIAKYEAIKKATVNLLLEPKAGWKRMKLDEICMCLDNYRKPVNEVERASMHGDIPYCGANGIVDYVNDFTIDDSIILIAEDGGYFDQYESRPIAYRMSGKAWINNHAHILKAKRDYCQDFIFYSLEHKDITPFITSGTRAKLTKGELSNIEIDTPHSFQEQRKIAEKIIAIDNALADYKAQLEKARQLKSGMMSYFFG